MTKTNAEGVAIFEELPTDYNNNKQIHKWIVVDGERVINPSWANWMIYKDMCEMEDSRNGVNGTMERWMVGMIIEE